MFSCLLRQYGKRCGNFSSTIDKFLKDLIDCFKWEHFRIVVGSLDAVSLKYVSLDYFFAVADGNMICESGD